MYENYSTVVFVARTWLDVPDWSNPPSGAVSFSPETFQRLEDAIAENRNSLLTAKQVLPENFFSENTPIDLYPECVEIDMDVTGWNDVSRGFVTIRKTEYAYGRQYMIGADGEDYRRSFQNYSAPEWTPETAYTIGDRVQPSILDGHIYETTTDGTSGISEPIWDSSGANITDNDLTWVEAGAYWSPWQVLSYA